MSKKDYQAIATAIYQTHRIASYLKPGIPESVAASVLRTVAQEIADVCAMGNPRFDRARFLEACETGKCKGMPARDRKTLFGTCGVCLIRSKMPGRERCSVCVGA